MFIQFFLDTYYIVIMAWALYYMFMSFTSKLPYSHCDNEWNTPCCLATGASGLDVNETTNETTMMTSTEMSYDPTGTPSWNLTDPCNGTTISSTVEFWE